MNITKITLTVAELKIGDEFWGEPPYRHDYGDSTNGHPTFVYRVISEPQVSINRQLFWDGLSNCIVVGVEYLDGARGSRLFDPTTEITIRRDASAKPA